MFAIVCTGNQQFKVSPGDLIRVPYLDGKKSQATVELKVLALQGKSDFLAGSADLKKASVKAVVLGHGLGKKSLVFKKKRRKGYRRTKGHRQAFTTLRITEINASSDKTVSQRKSDRTEPRKVIGETLKSEKIEDKKQARGKSPIRKVKSKTSTKKISDGKARKKNGGK